MINFEELKILSVRLQYHIYNLISKGGKNPLELDPFSTFNLTLEQKKNSSTPNQNLKTFDENLSIIYYHSKKNWFSSNKAPMI